MYLPVDAIPKKGRVIERVSAADNFIAMHVVCFEQPRLDLNSQYLNVGLSCLSSNIFLFSGDLKNLMLTFISFWKFSRKTVPGALRGGLLDWRVIVVDPLQVQAPTRELWTVDKL